ncbi:MAG: tetratricopeptide repeat protein [Acidobacteria bacterium]|nr:tetratricopeptide repeat protein [Acidobacteriota bacterium]
MCSGKFKNIFSTKLFGLALILWLPWSCQTRPSATPASPSTNYFDLGEKYFEAEDYAKAVEAYNLYLQGNPATGYHDRALFRLALAYALPSSPVRDLSRATETWQRLIRLFPQSFYTPQAQFLLQSQAETEQLRGEVQLREAQIQQLQLLEVELQVKQGDIEKLQTEASRREQRIRQLTQELEKLKQIDMQRRPSALPP